jgi:hypothetical protein
MRPAGYMLTLAISSLTASWLFAAEPATKAPAAKTEQPAAPEKNAAADKSTADKDKKPAADAAKAGDEKTAADKASSEKGGEKASPQRFIPSEQVRADFDVSFPVDI